MHSVINTEELIGKTVGRRKPPADPFACSDALQRCLPPIPVRKGVYRFLTHEEADQWLMNRLTRKTGN
jgi:hypothetical protein